MKLSLLILALMLISCELFSQRERIDSLKMVLNTTKIDTVRLNTLNELVVQYGGLDIAMAEKFLDSMINLSIAVKAKRHELTAYSQQGILQYRRGNIREAISIWKKALRENEFQDYPKQKSNFLNNIAVGHKGFKEKDSVLKYLTAGIKLNEEQGNEVGLVGNYFVISDFYFQEREYYKSIQYLNKLQSVALRTNDRQALARVNILLANISRKEYDFPDAINYFNAALSYYIDKEPNNLVMITGLKYEVIKTKIRQKRYKETIEDIENLKNEYGGHGENDTFWEEVNMDLLISYYSTEKIEEGYPVYNSLSGSRLELSENLVAIKLLTLAAFEILTNRTNDSTLNRLTKAQQITEKLDMQEQLLFCLEMLGRYHLMKRNTALSLNFFDEARHLRDSLSTFQSRIINLSQKRRFNEAQKENENLALRQQNAEQALFTEKVKRQKTVMAGGIIVSLASLAIFFLVCARSKRQKKEIEKQKKLVEELQREMHHRLKNNLSYIDFFITLAKGKFPDPAYREKLDELQNRIDSMFEVHKQLFQKQDVTNLNAQTYIAALVENVKNSYSKPNIDIEEKVEDFNLRADTSFPIGLIVNEFVTNSYKHAFPNGEKGVISVNFKEGRTEYYLRLSDSGKGLAPDFDIKQQECFGLETIKLLTQEYKGTFKLDGNDGVQMDITFPKKTDTE